uniref:BED-type domain-containing protein n=1 Tax=Panagrolaimus superbus TaxID=310955 RepID=A0A914YKA2_9BILA
MSNFTSKYDKYFSKIYTENKHLYQWTCRLCGLVTAPTIHTTTEIRRHHLKTRHPEDFADIEPRKVKAPIGVKKRKVKDIIIANTSLKKVRTENDINSDKIDNTIMELISSSSFPISTINDPAFDRLLKLLNPIYILKRWIFTFLTCFYNSFFKNDELKPQHFILALQPINLDKIMLKLYERLEEIFGEFNLDWSKVTHIIQAGNLESEDLECDPEWHVEICLSLGLQVSIEDAMKDVQALDTVILKVKKLLRKLRKSKTLKQAFIDYQKLEDFPEKCLDSEVQIFWDILYSIFLSFQQNKISLQVFLC